MMNNDDEIDLVLGDDTPEDFLFLAQDTPVTKKKMNSGDWVAVIVLLSGAFVLCALVFWGTTAIVGYFVSDKPKPVIAAKPPANLRHAAPIQSIPEPKPVVDKIAEAKIKLQQCESQSQHWGTIANKLRSDKESLVSQLKAMGVTDDLATLTNPTAKTLVKELVEVSKQLQYATNQYVAFNKASLEILSIIRRSERASAIGESTKESEEVKKALESVVEMKIDIEDNIESAPIILDSDTKEVLEKEMAIPQILPKQEETPVDKIQEKIIPLNDNTKHVLLFSRPTDAIWTEKQVLTGNKLKYITFEAEILFTSEHNQKGVVFAQLTGGQAHNVLLAGPNLIGGFNYPATAIELNRPVSLVDNTWHHIAFVQSLIEERIFLDGRLLFSRSTGVVPIPTGNARARIGGMIGYIASIRISNNARYNKNFIHHFGYKDRDNNILLWYDFTKQPKDGKIIDESNPHNNNGLMPKNSVNMMQNPMIQADDTAPQFVPMPIPFPEDEEE